jgi:hypothetical protein
MYDCNNCNYSTNKKSSWKKHLETKKHKKNEEKEENMNYKIEEETEEEKEKERQREIRELRSIKEIKEMLLSMIEDKTDMDEDIAKGLLELNEEIEMTEKRLGLKKEDTEEDDGLAKLEEEAKKTEAVDGVINVNDKNNEVEMNLNTFIYVRSENKPPFVIRITKKLPIDKDIDINKIDIEALSEFHKNVMLKRLNKFMNVK